MTSQEYILSVLKLPFSDEDKAAMIVKLIDAGIKAGVATVSDTTIAKAPAIQAQSTPAPAAPVVAPDLLIPAPIFKPAEAVTYHAENGLRVDDIVPQGTPGTVYLPMTGHVVSLPSPGAGKPGGELVLGYLNRVKLQLHAADLVNRANATLAIQGWDPAARAALLDPTDLGKWPEIADRLTNADAYLTQAQKAAAAFARQQIVSGMQNLAPVAVAPAAAPVPDTVPVPFENR